MKIRYKFPVDKIMYRLKKPLNISIGEIIQIIIAFIMLSSVIIALKTSQASFETAEIMKKEAAFVKRPVIRIYKGLRDWGTYLSIEKVKRGDKLTNAVCFDQFFVIRNEGYGPAYIKFIGALLIYKGRIYYKFYRGYDNLVLESNHEEEGWFEYRRRLEPIGVKSTLTMVADYENKICFPIEDYETEDITLAAKVEYSDYLGNEFDEYFVFGLINDIDKEHRLKEGIDRKKALEDIHNWRWFDYLHSESASKVIDNAKSILNKQFSSNR